MFVFVLVGCTYVCSKLLDLLPRFWFTLLMPSVNKIASVHVAIAAAKLSQETTIRRLKVVTALNSEGRKVRRLVSSNYLKYGDSWHCQTMKSASSLLVMCHITLSFHNVALSMYNHCNSLRGLERYLFMDDVPINTSCAVFGVTKAFKKTQWNIKNWWDYWVVQ